MMEHEMVQETEMKLVSMFARGKLSDKAAAENAGQLFSIKIEETVTANDLHLICDTVAQTLGLKDGIELVF